MKFKRGSFDAGAFFDSVVGASIAFFVPLMVAVFAAMLGWILVTAATGGFPTEFEAASQFVQECVASDLYTREECLIMAGEQ